MAKTLLVFDIDGTLLKSEHIHTSSYLSTMKAIGISDVNEEWHTYEHHTDSHILKVNYERLFRKDIDAAVIDNFEKLMTQKILDMAECTQITDAQSVIQSIEQSDDHDMCFATGSFRQPVITKLILAQLDINNDLLVGANRYYKREEIILQAIAQAKDINQQKEYDLIISFGDGIWDLQAARNLNIEFVGVGTEHRETLSNMGAKYHLDDWTNYNLNIIKQALGQTT